MGDRLGTPRVVGTFFFFFFFIKFNNTQGKKFTLFVNNFFKLANEPRFYSISLNISINLLESNHVNDTKLKEEANA